MSEKGTNRAKFYQLALFPMNNGATNVYFVLILSYIATFGNKVLGLAMVFASFMVTGMRVFDAITDPIIGALMDKTNGKFGKFRPFMVLGNIVMAVSVILLYMVTPIIPKDAMWLRYTVFVALYAVWVLGYTFQTSVTRSAQPVLTNDPKQRPLFTIFNTIGSLVGMGVMQFVGPILAGDGFAGDYNASWFRIMTPIGVVVSIILTILAIVGIWEKDNEKYFGLGGKQEKVKVSEYISIIKANKPLQRLMVAGGGCKLALAIATNVTVLCMIYGCMTQFGLGVSSGFYDKIAINNNTKEIINLKIEDDTQVIGLIFDSPTIEQAEAKKPNIISKIFGSSKKGNNIKYEIGKKANITDIEVTTAGELFDNEPATSSTIKVVKPVQAVVLCFDQDGNPQNIHLDKEGKPVGLQYDANGKIAGLSVPESDTMIGLLVNDDGLLISTKNEIIPLSITGDGIIGGINSEDTIKLSGRNKYDSLYLIMMVLGYVFSAPFFLLTVRTSQKHGQKKSLMTYVAVALACYIGVLTLLLLWKQGNPAFNFTLFDNGRLAPNLYTVLFILFFGVGYGAYYSTADMPIPMVADCADYETYRSGKFIPGIMGTLFSLVDKLVSSLSATVVSVALLFIGVPNLATKTTPYVDGMNWVVIALFCVVPMVAWLLTLWAMKGYELDGKRVKTIQAVNAARKAAIADGMSLQEAMSTINDDTVNHNLA